MAILSADSAFVQSSQSPLSPTVRTAISSPRSPASYASSDDGWDFLHEAKQDKSDNALKLKLEAPTPPRPSSRASRASTSRSGPQSPPGYTNVNPFIYRTSAHSFTHSWPTHRLIACPRCNETHAPGSERNLATFESHGGGLSLSTTSSSLLNEWSSSGR